MAAHWYSKPVIVHLNGRLIDQSHACVSVFDRGFLFGDGVYEGLRTTHGVVIGLDQHIDRMRQGLSETRIEGFDPLMLESIADELLSANGIQDAFVYLQVTRGVPADGAARSRVPARGNPPTVFAYCTPVAPVEACRVPEVRTVALRPDTRWTRGHVKAISLLGGVLAAIEAAEVGADDAIMHRDGLVTEGTATNVFAVLGGRVVTPPLACAPMLAGVTRRLLLSADPSIEERPIGTDELLRADEVMLVGTRTMVASVSRIDGRRLPRPAPGEHARRLLSALCEAITGDTEPRLAKRKQGATTHA